jgi:hypothetical protein
VDVLAFVDESHGALVPVDYRQLTVNGNDLAALVGADTSAPLTADSPGEHQLRYLQGLLGGRSDNGLRAGRIAIGFCRNCHDSSCGEMVAASVEFSATTVSWTDIGFETEHVGTLEQRFGGWLGNIGARAVAPPEWWTPSPIAGLAYTFDRGAYTTAIEKEIAHVGS